VVPTSARTTGAPVRAVLFDLDDTLFDHTFSLRTGLAAIWRSDPALRSHPFRDVVGEYERLLDEIHPDVLQGRKTHAEARAERFRRLFAWAGSRATAAELEAATREYRASYQASRRAVDGAAALLRSLHGRVTIGVVSNNHLAEQREKVAAIGIGPYLDFLLTSEEAGAEKPSPAIFRMALERASVRPEETVMVGDNWAADIVGAHGSGIRSVWLNRRKARPLDSPPNVPEFRSFRPVRRLRSHLLGAGAPEPPTGGAAVPGL
jgi:HAD superfamily hydrolase (TIGR01549 family)